jgi:dimethylhistidine N-methyltransferase
MGALAKPRLQFNAESHEAAIFAVDAIAGLTRTPKSIPPKYFYDREGSRLFEEITRQPEYYPTRCELEILSAHAGKMAELIPEGAVLIEFGSGSATKAKILLDAAAAKLAAYVPVDISGEFLEREAEELRKAFPALTVAPVAADFMQPFDLPMIAANKPRVGFFPGSTIGNLEPHDAAAFLKHACLLLGDNSLLIIGVDLVKDIDILNAAYNDKAGITEAFNFNLLDRMNRELAADFKRETFEHHAFYNRERRRIEMHLASLKRQKVRVAGQVIDFRAGDTIHTENSYKYTPGSFSALARGSRWKPVEMWTDSQNLFAVYALVHNSRVA